MAGEEDRNERSGTRSKRLWLLYVIAAVIVVIVTVVVILIVAGGNQTEDGETRDQLSTSSSG